MSEKNRTVKRKITKLKGLGIDVEALSKHVYEAKNKEGQHFCLGLSQLETWTVDDIHDTLVNYWKRFCGK